MKDLGMMVSSFFFCLQFVIEKILIQCSIHFAGQFEYFKTTSED